MDGKAARGIPVEAQTSGREMNEYEGEPAVAADVRDITERKRAEEEKYRHLVEDINDGYLVVRGNKVLFANKRVAEFLGIPLAEIIGGSFLQHLTPDSREKARQVYEKTRRAEPPPEVEEFAIQREDGSSVPLEVRFREITYEGERAYCLLLRDITERKQAEEALRESEEKYRHLFEDLTDAAFLADIETGLILETNLQGEALLGKSRNEIVGIHQRQLHPPGKADEYRRRFAAHIEKGHAADYDGEVIKKDGTIVPVRITASTLTIGGRHLILGLFRDVTERRRAEEALRESEERLRALIENAPDAIWIHDVEAKFIIGNKKAEEMTGYSREELIGKNFLEVGLLPEEYLPQAIEALEKSIKGDPTGLDEYELIRKDGSRVSVEITSIPVERGGKVEIMGIARDITERKKAEEELRDSEEMSRGMLESAATGIYIVQKGKFQYVSPMFEEISGYTSDELIGTYSLRYIHPKDREAARKKAIESLKGQSSLPYEFRFIRKDGEVIWIMDKVASIQYRGEQATVGSFMDITERKEAQEYIVQTERHRALAEMAGGVAHDFNNVLSIVLGRAQLALEDVKETKVKKSLQIIEQSVHDAAKMVRRLQEFAGATVSEELEALDLNRVVKSALQMVEARRIESQVMGVEIDISADLGEVPTMEGNPAELREVLLNIIFNAMDALPEGGRITVKTAQEDSGVVLSISDTGIGMTKEVQKRIFDPFFTTKSPRGVGLGLSASHGIITKYGGSIEVDSTLGKGSTFYIRLPILNGTWRKARGNNNNASHAKETIRILLVDDDPEVAEVLELMLRQLGHRVTTVHSGKKALDAFSSEDYDLVITDLYMPDLSGQEVARAVKERKAGVPVLLITGWGLQLDPSEMGVDSMIAKPFSKETLSQQITEVLANVRRL